MSMQFEGTGTYILPAIWYYEISQIYTLLALKSSGVQYLLKNK